jgi:hypothetical protein
MFIGVAPINLNGLTRVNGGFRFTFTNSPGVSFTVLGATDVSTPANGWSNMGTATEVSPGVYQFTDYATAGSSRRFYRVAAL